MGMSKTRVRTRGFALGALRLSAVAAVLLTALGPVGALEIYRIGGQDLPRPQGAGVNFHQMTWDESELQEGLNPAVLADGSLRPIFIEPGVNVAATSLLRGGGPYVRVSGVASYSITNESSTMIDLDEASGYNWKAIASSEQVGQAFRQTHRITLDLGGELPVNRVRIFPLAIGQYPDQFEIATSLSLQGKDSASGYGGALLQGETVFNLQENTADTIDVSFPSILARTVDMLLTRTSAKDISVAEIEVYGEGFIRTAAFVSSFIDLGQPAVWGDLRWGGTRDGEALIRIQTRAGDDLDPNLYWRNTGRGSETTRLRTNGQPLDAATYKSLKPGEAAGITYDTENWSFWSAPYTFADSGGTPVQSPGPNSVFQLRVDFLPTLTDGGGVDWVEFAATIPPLAEDVIGEISPGEVVLGEQTMFTYVLRPTIRAEHSGFDRIELVSPFGLRGVDEVRIGGSPVDFVLGVEQDSTRFSIALSDKLDRRDSGVVIEVDFQAAVLRYGVAFDGWVSDSERPGELPQRINPGDAAAEYLNDGLRVRTVLSDLLLTGLTINPRVVTPNGDGINDAVRFDFDVVQLTGTAPLRLEIFDLSGHRVRVLADNRQQSGSYRLDWDGHDDANQLLPPGLYVYRIAVDAEQGTDERTGTLALVY
jgi:hypothetical protein